MPRDLVLGNGRLLVAFDGEYHLRDLFFPHVGSENHTAGHPFRMGVWADGRFSWVHGADWVRDLRYEPRTLVTKVTLTHSEWGLRLEVEDAVDFHQPILLRRARFHNRQEHTREVQLFFSSDFHIYGVDVGDTAFYNPASKAVIHYKGERYFLIGGAQNGEAGIDSWATGLKEVGGVEGTWRDAEDGILERNPIAQGSVDSTVSLRTLVPPGGTADLSLWVCAGRTLEEVCRLDGLVRHRTLGQLTQRTRAYWHLWAEKERYDFGDLPAAVVEQFYRSLLIIRTQIDDSGGIVAANDSDMLHHSRDTYSYVWLRDGAFVAAALSQAGHRDQPIRFFDFCNAVVQRDGFFLQKYTPRRSLASSWHPWVRDGVPELPIQEDETALVLWALWNHFVSYRDVEAVAPYFRRLVVNTGEFLARYRNLETGLPQESWDLWEERRGVHTYTAATVYAALTAAGHFATVFGEEEKAALFYEAAKEVRAAVLERLIHPDAEVFVRGLAMQADGTYAPDLSADASLLLLPRFGLVAADDPVMTRTAAMLREKLWVRAPAGGMARYTGDQYHRNFSPSSGIPGNPWFICTLWYADYLIMRATSRTDLEPAVEILQWVTDRARASGVMAEQIDALTGEPLSVAPLTWSHAAFVSTVLRLLDRWHGGGAGPACGVPGPGNDSPGITLASGSFGIVGCV